MKSNFEFRNEAFNLLKAKWKEAVLLYFIISIISIVAAFIVPEEVSIATTLLLIYPCNYVFIMQLMSFVREGKENLTSDYFSLLKEKYSVALPVTALTFIYTFLWTLLLIVPGVIKGYSYAMTSYISIDNKNLTAEECVNASMKMMDGHKWRLFLLDLSFILWYLLSIITFGIALFWVAPYHQIARIKFYEDLKSQPQVIEE